MLVWGRNVLEPTVQGQGLRQILTMDRSVHLPPDLRGSNTSNLRDQGWTVWRPFLSSWGWRPLGTQNVLETIVTMMLTFIVFTFGSLLVAVQIAGGQMTPRIMAATLLRDNVIRFSVGLFTFTLLVAIGALARLETTVPPFVAFVAGLLGICSLAAFLFLIDYAARLLTPSAFSRASATKDARSSRASTATGLVAQTPLINRIGSFQRRTGSLSIAASPRHSWR